MTDPEKGLYSQKISLNINGIELTAVVVFKFWPGQPAQTSGPSDSWAEEEPDEYELLKLSVDGWDITSLLGIDEIMDDITELIDP